MSLLLHCFSSRLVATAGLVWSLLCISIVECFRGFPSPPSPVSRAQRFIRPPCSSSCHHRRRSRDVIWHSSGGADGSARHSASFDDITIQKKGTRSEASRAFRRRHDKPTPPPSQVPFDTASLYALQTGMALEDLQDQEALEDEAGDEQPDGQEEGEVAPPVGYSSWAEYGDWSSHTESTCPDAILKFWKQVLEGTEQQVYSNDPVFNRVIMKAVEDKKLDVGDMKFLIEDLEEPEDEQGGEEQMVGDESGEEGEKEGEYWDDSEEEPIDLYLGEDGQLYTPDGELAPVDLAPEQLELLKQNLEQHGDGEVFWFEQSDQDDLDVNIDTTTATTSTVPAHDDRPLSLDHPEERPFPRTALRAHPLGQHPEMESHQEDGMARLRAIRKAGQEQAGGVSGADLGPFAESEDEMGTFTVSGDPQALLEHLRSSPEALRSKARIRESLGLPPSPDAEAVPASPTDASTGDDIDLVKLGILKVVKHDERTTRGEDRQQQGAEGGQGDALDRLIGRVAYDRDMDEDGAEGAGAEDESWAESVEPSRLVPPDWKQEVKEMERSDDAEGLYLLGTAILSDILEDFDSEGRLTDAARQDMDDGGEATGAEDEDNADDDEEELFKASRIAFEWIYARIVRFLIRAGRVDLAYAFHRQRLAAHRTTTATMLGPLVPRNITIALAWAACTQQEIHPPDIDEEDERELELDWREAINGVAVARELMGVLGETGVECADLVLPQIAIAMLKRGSIEDAVAVLDEVLSRIRRGDAAPTLDILNTLIRECGRAGGVVGGVFTVLDMMAEADLTPNHDTYEAIVQAVVAGVDFEKSCAAMADLPTPERPIPEVVFVGRSNVGKSSLVNMVLNRKQLASTSETAGHTRTFDYYRCNRNRTDGRPEFYLVDVPGMGFAENVSRGMQDSWRGLHERYFRVRESLRVVFHLIDSRRPPMNTDVTLMNMVREALDERPASQRFAYVVVLTKVDKIGYRETSVKKAVEQTVECLTSRGGWPASHLPPIITSSAAKKTRHGRDDIWRHMRAAFSPAEAPGPPASLSRPAPVSVSIPDGPWSASWLGERSIEELREMCRGEGLTVSGSRHQLVDRLMGRERERAKQTQTVGERGEGRVLVGGRT
ncbi:unnamed protein product [Vitrella brassicaformis CCMP3155]|uniref:SAP domain-containing protein n=3 Tax=Vitrella brassicaformis TaxID=1169539 RepID=A0A0G4EX81_VITBC|nr:unnamed protein product [Vitrella brassicaformis CCMP3155]|eukprot:CEM03286.1 unnamed protein product [Vitrella brassicaformis CCMP3155]